MDYDNLAIIVAGGSGLRMGAPIPKQFLLLNGRPILMHTIDAFLQVDFTRVILVLPASQTDYWHDLCLQHHYSPDISIAHGGSTRYESVKNGLALWRSESLIAVHDGVRPLISTDTIRRCFADATTYGTSVPALPSVESVRLINIDGSNHAIDRRQVMMIQTPQVFKADILINAYNQPYTPLFTDDASVVETAGTPIHLSEGQHGNIKITTPDDMQAAEAILTNA